MLNVFATMAVYNRREITRPPYKQPLQVQTQGHKDAKILKISFSLFPNGGGLFPGSLKAEMKRQYVQFLPMSIYRLASEDISLSAEWRFEGC